MRIALVVILAALLGSGVGIAIGLWVMWHRASGRWRWWR